MAIILIVRIAIWVTFFLLIADSILLSLLFPREIHKLQTRVKKIEDWIKGHDASKPN